MDETSAKSSTALPDRRPSLFEKADAPRRDDRLTRSVIDLGTLLNGYFLNEALFGSRSPESLDTRNAMGRLSSISVALIAQWEREAIGERTREAMRHLKAQGVFLGRAPTAIALEPLRCRRSRTT